MYIKKFYDMEASDVASGSSEEMQSSSQSAAPQQGESIAAIMAREGTKSSSDGEDISPVRLNNDGSWESKASKEDSPAVPAKGNSAQEMDFEESSSTKTEAQIPQHQKDEESQQSYSWQEAIKQEQPDEVLKALGFDDKTASFVKDLQSIDPKMVSFLNYWKDGGDLKAYFEEVSKDYASMPAEDVMRHQIRLDYPKANEAQLDVLFKKEIVEKYNLNSFDEDELNEGKLLLEARADKYRDDLSKTQEEKLLPNAPDYSAQQLEQEQLIKEFANGIVNDFNENSYTKEVLSKNSITIGEGAEKFSFPIDGKEIANLVINGDTDGQYMFDKKIGANGEEALIPKAQHQLLVATVNKYGEKFITELAKHYKSLGSKAAIDPIENARPTESRNVSNAAEEPSTLAGAMAKYGRLNSGGW